MTGHPFIFGAGYGGSGGDSGGATLTIEVFLDAGLTIPCVSGVDFQDDIWIHINTDLTSPTEYRFLIFDNGLDGTRVIDTVDTLEWTVRSFNNILIYAEAKNATDPACALTAFELTINSDVDANNYIAAHNALSGLTMDMVQQEVWQNVYAMTKGVGTPFGSDLLTYHRTNADTRAFMLSPVNNTTVSAAGYTLDMIHLAVGTYNGFVPTDFTVNGAVGGSGKYFDMGVAPSSLPIGSISNGVYSRTNADQVSVDVGSSETSGQTLNSILLLLRFSSNVAQIISNDSTISNVTNANSLGHHMMNRVSGIKSLVKNGTFISSLSVATTGQSTRNTYAHAMNRGGTADFYSSRQLAGYYQLLGMTTNQAVDWNYIMTYYQTNIITGGRNV